MSENTPYIGDNEVIDLKLLELIKKHSDDPEADIERVTAYNVITPLVLSKITNRSISAIQNLMRAKQTSNGIYFELDQAFPFKLGNEPGPSFILFNEKCKNYIEKTLALKQSNGTTNSTNRRKTTPTG